MRSVLHIIVLIAFIGAGCRAPSSSHYDYSIPSISLIRIIADPHTFSGKQVEVVGYLLIEDHTSLLFVYEDDARNYLLVNAIRVEVPTEMRLRLESFTSRYVSLRGTFDSSADHIAGMTAGVLKDVSACMTKGIGVMHIFPDISNRTDDDPFMPPNP